MENLTDFEIECYFMMLERERKHPIRLIKKKSYGYVSSNHMRTLNAIYKILNFKNQFQIED
jgi:hypothetical protein